MFLWCSSYRRSNRISGIRNLLDTNVSWMPQLAQIVRSICIKDFVHGLSRRGLLFYYVVYKYAYVHKIGLKCLIRYYYIKLIPLFKITLVNTQLHIITKLYHYKHCTVLNQITYDSSMDLNSRPFTANKCQHLSNYWLSN